MLGNIFPTITATCTWYWKPWPNTRIVRFAKITHYCHSTKFAYYHIGGSKIKTLLYAVNANLAVYQFSNVTENRGQAGRPRVRIEEETLLHFRNIGYSWKEIAELLLVSRWTILRTVRAYGIENQAGFSSITDDVLDNIRDFKINNGNFVEDLWFWDIFHRLHCVYNNGGFPKPWSESIE